MRIHATAALLALLPLAASCNTVTVRDAKGIKLEGITYYEPTPYLKVVRGSRTEPRKPTEADKSETKEVSTVSYEIIWLPNMDEKRTINQCTFWGGGSLEVALTDGWMLSSLKGSRDTGAFEALIGGVAEGAGWAPDPASSDNDPIKQRYLLYPIVIKGDHIRIDRHAALEFDPLDC